MLFFKRDMAATREARRSGRFLSKDSKLTQPRWVGSQGQIHYLYVPHERLAGADMRARYREVAEKQSVCQQCGKRGDKLEMDHIVSRGRGGCDCIENLQMLCWNFDGSGCHQKKHLERKAYGLHTA
jgi:5-methylcytosine-specific restriction endonuclease McrA